MKMDAIVGYNNPFPFWAFMLLISISDQIMKHRVHVFVRDGRFSHVRRTEQNHNVSVIRTCATNETAIGLDRNTKTRSSAVNAITPFDRWRRNILRHSINRVPDKTHSFKLSRPYFGVFDRWLYATASDC